jgi:tetratricopeptide (TPR) repeat protein
MTSGVFNWNWTRLGRRHSYCFLLGVASVSLLCITSVGQTAGNNEWFGSSARNGQQAGTIGCIVVDTQGNPVSDAMVEVRSSSGIVTSGATDMAGRCQFSKLPFGQYEATASRGLASAEQAFNVNGFVNDDVVMRLPADAADSKVGGRNTVSAAQLKVPRKATNELEKADRAFQKGNMTSAADHVQRALTIYPAFADALVLKGILGLGQNNLTGACADLEQAIKYDPSLATAYFALGTAYNNMHRYAEAKQVLEHGVPLAPAAWQPYYEGARADLGSGDFRTALREIRKAEQLAPSTFAALYLVKGYVLVVNRDIPGAIAAFHYFLSKEPTGLRADKVHDVLQHLQANSASQAGPDHPAK